MCVATSDLGKKENPLAYSLCDEAFLCVVDLDSDLRADVQVFSDDGHSGSSGTRALLRLHGQQLWDLNTDKTERGGERQRDST